MSHLPCLVASWVEGFSGPPSPRPIARALRPLCGLMAGSPCLGAWPPRVLRTPCQVPWWLSLTLDAVWRRVSHCLNCAHPDVSRAPLPCATSDPVLHPGCVHTNAPPCGASVSGRDQLASSSVPLLLPLLCCLLCLRGAVVVVSFVLFVRVVSFVCVVFLVLSSVVLPGSARLLVSLSFFVSLSPPRPLLLLASVVSLSLLSLLLC